MRAAAISIALSIAIIGALWTFATLSTVRDSVVDAQGARCRLSVGC